jgi:hypothetical protein
MASWREVWVLGTKVEVGPSQLEPLRSVLGNDFIVTVRCLGRSGSIRPIGYGLVCTRTSSARPFVHCRTRTLWDTPNVSANALT